jgi:ATP-dependent Clp endopeptidase proteolytic subunit ClpP
MVKDADELNITYSGNELYFYEEVNTESVLCLNTMLKTMEREVHGPIILYINSPGGDVFCGLSAMDHVAAIKVPVHTVADGLCCSAATFIFLAGEKRFIKPHAHVLIHQISQESEWVRFEDMKDELKNLEKLMDNVIQIYRDMTELPETKLKRMMKRDMYLDADDCITYKIADEIFPSFQYTLRSKRQPSQ